MKESGINDQRGFTLIEMMVVIVIFGILTIIVIVGGSSFRNSVLLKNLAYDIALTIREAQVYGTSVRAEGGSFERAYGVSFKEGNWTVFDLYQDFNGNGIYDAGDVVIRRNTITGGNAVADFCLTSASGQRSCASSPPSNQWAHITFLRPDPDAQIRATAGSNLMSRAEIIVASPGGTQYIVTVESTGQISVESSAP